MAIPKRMSIKTACRLLRCANDNQLARRLGAQQGTIGYWKKQGGMVPALWRDRIELMLYKERSHPDFEQHRRYPPGSGSITVLKATA